MAATPTTPSATARMVAIESLASDSPLVEPATRAKKARPLRDAESPLAIKMVAMTNEGRNNNILTPTLATIETACRAKSASFGCML